MAIFNVEVLVGITRVELLGNTLSTVRYFGDWFERVKSVHIDRYLAEYYKKLI